MIDFQWFSHVFPVGWNPLLGNSGDYVSSISNETSRVYGEVLVLQQLSLASTCFHCFPLPHPDPLRIIEDCLHLATVSDTRIFPYMPKEPQIIRRQLSHLSLPKDARGIANP